METWIDQHEQLVCDAKEAESRIAALESELAASGERLIEWGARFRTTDPELAAERVEAQLAASEAQKCRHGWRGSTPESVSRIETPCPACGLRSLFVASGNHLTCANLACTEPGPEFVVSVLRSQLAASEAKRAEQSQIIDLHRTSSDRHKARAEEAEKGKAEAERLAVEAVRCGAHLVPGMMGSYALRWKEDGASRSTREFDGTPAGILAALRQAEAKGDD